MESINGDSFRWLLTVCDGNMRSACSECDDLLGGVALAEMAHTNGHAVWLRDIATDELVACSTAACFGCEREGDCGDSLDCLDSDAAAAFFIAFLRENDYPPHRIRMR